MDRPFSFKFHRKLSLRALFSLFQLAVLSQGKKVSSKHDQVPVGAVVHVFPRYGYFPLSMRVNPRNDSMSWILLEPIRNVFMETTVKIEEWKYESADKRTAFNQTFQIDFCDNMSQLLQAYFKQFEIEGLDKPWNAFSGGWQPQIVSKYLGVERTFLEEEYRFIFMKASLTRKFGIMNPLQNVTAREEFRGKIDDFGADGKGTLYKFANEVGTHYIKSFSSGNAVYQILVFEQEEFDEVKQHVSDYLNLPKEKAALSQIPRLLPSQAIQVGKMHVLNSSPEKTLQVRNLLRQPTFTHTTMPNIFKLLTNPDLIDRLDDILMDEPSALLGLELKALSLVFTNIEQRNLFVKELHNSLQLWENNL